jgi:hypothetical protein
MSAPGTDAVSVEARLNEKDVITAIAIVTASRKTLLLYRMAQ